MSLTDPGAISDGPLDEPPRAKVEALLEEFRAPVVGQLLVDPTFLTLVALEWNLERIAHEQLFDAAYSLDDYIAVTTFDTAIHALELVEDLTYAYACERATAIMDDRKGQDSDSNQGREASQ